jgi:hypothetical protein
VPREREKQTCKSEWVAPVATGLAGIVGIFFTWLSGKQGREHAADLAREEREHVRQLAKNDRVQRRLEETYLALLGMAERVGLWARAVWPLMDTIPPQPVPPLPSRRSKPVSKRECLSVSVFSDARSTRIPRSHPW